MQSVYSQRKFLAGIRLGTIPVRRGECLCLAAHKNAATGGDARNYTNLLRNYGIINKKAEEKRKKRFSCCGYPKITADEGAYIEILYD